MKEYKGPMQYKGIDDLLPELPYRCMDYGSEGCLSRYGKDNPYYMYLFIGIDENDDNAIEEEILRRKAYNNDYIRDLKESGEYNSELGQVSLFIEEDEEFDKSCLEFGESVSYKYDIIFLEEN